MTASETCLDLHIDLYPREAVEIALAAFSAVADLALESAAPYHRVRIKTVHTGSVEQVRAELANYALAASALAATDR